MGNSIKPITIPSDSDSDPCPDPFSYVPLVPLVPRSQSQSPIPTPNIENRKRNTSTSKTPRKIKTKAEKVIKKDYQQTSIKKYLVKKTPVAGSTVAGSTEIAFKGGVAMHIPLGKTNMRKRKTSMHSNNTKLEKTSRATQVLKTPGIGPLLPSESFSEVNVDKPKEQEGNMIHGDVSDNTAAKDVAKPEERPPRRRC